MLALLVVRVAPALATASVLSASPVAGDFGNGDSYGVVPGRTLTFTFTNPTASTVTVSDLRLIGADASEFRMPNNNCPLAVPAPGQVCSVQVTFQPTTAHAAVAALELTDGTGATLDVPLTGTGITGTLSAFPNPAYFQPQPWFNGSQQQDITIQDSPDAGVQATSMTITGPDAARFYISGGQNCTNQSYPAGGMCNVQIQFNPPNGPGIFHAQLQISSDSQSSPLTVPLTAAALSGPAAVVTPSETDFGNVALGSSAARTVTISNYGDSAMQVQGSFMVGTQSNFPVTADGCSGRQVDPGSSCQMVVAFQPSAVGFRQATLILLTNTPTTVLPVTFSGTGMPTLNGAATITGTTAAGSTLTCNPVGYPAGTSYQYQWLRNGQAIAGANTPGFVPLDANVGERLACRLLSTNSVSQQAATSPATAPIAPMTLSGELGAFTGQQTCRAVQVDHLLRVGHHAAIIRYGQPVTPWAPLTIASATSLQVRVDGQTLGRRKTMSITPRALSALADGIHKLTITAANKTTASQLLLAPCQLAVRFQGGPGQPTTLSASGRYGITTLTFKLPRQMHLNIRAGRNLGSATYVSAGAPPSEFGLVGPRTSWNNVRITLTPHTITVSNLPIQTGVVNIALRAGVITGRPGTLTATAKQRGSRSPRTARTPASWFR